LNNFFISTILLKKKRSEPAALGRTAAAVWKTISRVAAESPLKTPLDMPNRERLACRAGRGAIHAGYSGSHFTVFKRRGVISPLSREYSGEGS
jgi:hypothetical protein